MEPCRLAFVFSCGFPQLCFGDPRVHKFLKHLHRQFIPLCRVLLVERYVDSNNRVHMPVLGMWSVRRTLHSVSVGLRRGENQVGDKSPLHSLALILANKRRKLVLTPGYATCAMFGSLWTGKSWGESSGLRWWGTRYGSPSCSGTQCATTNPWGAS